MQSIADLKMGDRLDRIAEQMRIDIVDILGGLPAPKGASSAACIGTILLVGAVAGNNDLHKLVWPALLQVQLCCVLHNVSLALDGLPWTCQSPIGN